MKNASTIARATLVAMFLATPVAAFAEQDTSDAALSNALRQAKLPLERGLAASSREGMPISAKYELEDGRLQLSVYTMKGDSFAEVIVDYQTGKISKVVSIKDGEDLVAARGQKEPMARAKRSLSTAVSEAVNANDGYRAVSAIPELKDGHPAVKVMLVKGKSWKAVYEKLD
jgi:hypothetical protein